MKIKDFKYLEASLGEQSIETISDDRIMYMISYFSKIKVSDIENLNIKAYHKLFNKWLGKMEFKPSEKKYKWFYFQKNIWRRKELSSLNWADFIDLYKLSREPMKNINLLILKVWEPVIDITEVPDFSNLDINYVWKSILELIEFVASKLTKYKVLFKSEKKDNDPKAPKGPKVKEKEDKWGLLDATFHLLNDDVSKLEQLNKMNIDTVLIYLIWNKEKIEKLQALNNKK